MLSSLKNKKKQTQNTIINWYSKQNFTGKSINEKLGWPKKRGFKVRYKVMSEIIKQKKNNMSVLDFGCGFSNLYEYELKKKRFKVFYTGIDAVKSHVEYCNKRFPENDYYYTTLEKFKSKKKFDYIFANGVFTVKRELSQKDMILYTYSNLFKLFKLCKIGLAVNFMSINVDWKRKDLFHLSMDNLTDFVTKKLTRNFVIRNDYNLYEYTIYIYRK
jgi:SAM-dependent methyltransferase